MPELVSSTALAVVAPERGGRISSLEIRGREVIVGPVDEAGGERPAFGWGLYPMVPFAGRVRNARFGFDGTAHALAVRAAPHAIHGTVDDITWHVVTRDTGGIVMETDLGPDWPFRGTVRHTITLSDSGLDLDLVLTADDAMPAQVGWHPWIRRPATVEGSFTAWLPRDTDGMPTSPTTERMPSLDDEVDDCFVPAGSPVRIRADGTELELSSDCSHWVIYTGAAHGVCVEPQSGPPNEIESSPFVLPAGASLRRSFRISW